MQNTAPRPWGISRMRPYPATHQQPFATVS
jgi:putative ATP-grasp target RiPP